MTGFILRLRSLQFIRIMRDDARFHQSLFLLLSQVIALIAGFITNILTARMLGPAGFGNFALVLTVWAILTLALNPGWIQSGTRLLAVQHENDWHELTGAVFLFSAITSIVIILVSAFIARPLDQMIRSDISGILIRLSPLAFVFTLQSTLALIFQSTNRLIHLSIVNAVPSILTLAGIGILTFTSAISVVNVLLVELFSVGLVCISLCMMLQPSFTRAKWWLQRIMLENRSYGFPVYTGSMAGVLTSYLSRFLLSYFQNSAAVGIFSLTVQLTDPLKLVPNAMATASFRDFASQPRMPRRILLPAIVVCTGTLLVALFMYGWPLQMLYSSRFSAAGSLAMIVAVGALAHGFGDLFNRFLGAHGLGAKLRNAAIVVGIANVLGYGLLIPYFGLSGAGFTAVLAGFLYLAWILRSYFLFVHKQETI